MGWIDTQVIVKRGEPIPDGSGPIIVSTRNDALQGIVDATPAHRREGAHSDHICSSWHWPVDDVIKHEQETLQQFDGHSLFVSAGCKSS